MEAIKVESLFKSFGGVMAVRGVSLQVDVGGRLVIIGPNGAGKSTMFNVITGIYRPTGGSIRFRGEDLVGLRSDQICRKGVARTFQLVRICPSMTALENVLVGATYGKKGGGKKALSEALECLEILGLSHAADTVSSQLTYSDRKLIEIARAVAARPGLALLDEPLSGLNPTETERIMGVIRGVRKAWGISIIWIEHKMDAVFNLCDRIVVLDYGSKIAEGYPKEIAKDKKVVEAYLGEPLA